MPQLRNPIVAFVLTLCNLSRRKIIFCDVQSFLTDFFCRLFPLISSVVSSRHGLELERDRKQNLEWRLSLIFLTAIYVINL